MSILPIEPQPEDYLEATREIFGHVPNLTGLRLIAAELVHGFLITQFENIEGSPPRRYGALVRLPHSTRDRLWTAYAETRNVTDWVRWAIWLRVMEAYQTGDYLDQMHGPNDVRWLIDDRENGYRS
jgi:hypothetical protein